MNESNKELLREFLIFFPESKRHINPDLGHPLDFKRLVKLAKGLCDEGDTIEADDVRSLCSEIGCEKYLQLIEGDFTEFSGPIISKVNSIKQVISAYREL